MKARVAVSPVIVSLLPIRGAAADEGSLSVAPAPKIVATAPALGWVALEERNVWGLTSNRPTADYGADVLGGIWLLPEQLQVIVDAGWSRVSGTQNGVTIDTFRAGGRMAFGSALEHDGRVWVGGTAGLVVEGGWRHGLGGASLVTSGSAGTSDIVQSSASSMAWAVSPSISALVQARIARRLLVGAEVGVEHAIPALQWGSDSIFHCHHLSGGLFVVQFVMPPPSPALSRHTNCV